MKILFTNPLGQWGGTEKVLVDLLAGLKKKRPTWRLILWLGQDGPLRAQAQRLGVEVAVKPWPEEVAAWGEKGGSLSAIAAWWSYTKNLRAALRELQPDLIQANGVKMQLTMAWAKPAGSKLIWHLHDLLTPRWKSAWLLKRCKKRCDLAVANSHYTAADVEQAVGLKPRVIHNGVDTTEFSPQGEKFDLDQRVGWESAPGGTIRIGLVATYARWKGHEIFLQAAARCKKREKIRFYIVGGPIYQTRGSQWSLEELRQKIEELGLSACCGLTGFIDEAPAALRALDIVVQASREPEPFGMVIAQAMACGRAVVLSRAGGAAELLKEGRTAVSFPPGNDQALAAQLQLLLESPATREKLGSQGRQWVIDHFSVERMVQDWIKQEEALVA